MPPYKQLSVTADGKPLGDYTIPATNPGGSLLMDARSFALRSPALRVEVWERSHNHALASPRPCLTCPPGKLVRSWNGPRLPIMRSAAHAALLDLDPAFGRSSMDEGTARITEVLDSFYDSGALDLYAFIKERVQGRTAPMPASREES